MLISNFRFPVIGLLQLVTDCITVDWIELEPMDQAQGLLARLFVVVQY